MELTPQQTAARTAIQEWLARTNDYIFLLSGFAGSGKTTLIQELCAEWTQQALPFIVAAPTHKAKYVLQSKLVPGVNTTTVASLLSKTRQHTYVGTQVFSNGNTARAARYSLIIIDEISMVSDAEFELLRQLTTTNRIKLLCVGDSAQIPPIKQPTIRLPTGGRAKKPCEVFLLDSIPHFHLETILRYGGQVIAAATWLREHLDDKDACLGREFPKLVASFTELVRSVPFTEFKWLAYTNNRVSELNASTRAAFGFTGSCNEGELLTAYQTVGWPKPFIQNGNDYRVRAVKKGLWTERRLPAGNLVVLEDTSTHGRIQVFLPEPNHPDNRHGMRVLTMLARQVNRRGSSKKEYAQYQRFKEQFLFLENIYELEEGQWCSEKELRAQHPLLFLSMRDCLAGRVSAAMLEQVRTNYGDLLAQRRGDFKPVGDNELLATKFCVIVKDFDYGYALTAHKSQGSTIPHVFLDEQDFDRLDRARERNQLKYVALTRASESARVLES